MIKIHLHLIREVALTKNALVALGMESKHIGAFEDSAIIGLFNNTMKEQLAMREKLSATHWENWERFWMSLKKNPEVRMHNWKVNSRGNIVVEGDLIFEGLTIHELPAGIEDVRGDIVFLVCEFTSTRALHAFPKCARSVKLVECKNLKSLKGLESTVIRKELHISNCDELETLQYCPQALEISIRSCDRLHSLQGMPDIMNSVTLVGLDSLLTTKGLPIHLRGDLTIDNCNNLTELSLPENLDGNLFRDGSNEFELGTWSNSPQHMFD